MLALQIAHEFALEINIGLLGIQIQYGNGTDDCSVRAAIYLSRIETL